MNTMGDVKKNMSTLYAEVRNGTTDLKTAAELANIAGKFLKAEQLEFLREVFAAAQAKPIALHGFAPTRTIKGACHGD